MSEINNSFLEAIDVNSEAQSNITETEWDKIKQNKDRILSLISSEKKENFEIKYNEISDHFNENRDEIYQTTWNDLKNLKDLFESENLIDNEAIINIAKEETYEQLWISDNLWDNSSFENFSKWLIDEAIFWNADLAMQVLNTKGQIIFDALKQLATWEWLKQLAAWLWESVWNLFSWDSYQKWKSVAELWLLMIWAWAVVGVSKMWIKKALKQRVKNENIVEWKNVKELITQTNNNINDIIPKKQSDIWEIIKQWANNSNTIEWKNISHAITQSQLEKVASKYEWLSVDNIVSNSELSDKIRVEQLQKNLWLTDIQAHKVLIAHHYLDGYLWKHTPWEVLVKWKMLSNNWPKKIEQGQVIVDERQLKNNVSDILNKQHDRMVDLRNISPSWKTLDSRVIVLSKKQIEEALRTPITDGKPRMVMDLWYAWKIEIPEFSEWFLKKFLWHEHIDRSIVANLRELPIKLWSEMNYNKMKEFVTFMKENPILFPDNRNITFLEYRIWILDDLKNPQKIEDKFWKISDERVGNIIQNVDKKLFLESIIELKKDIKSKNSDIAFNKRMETFWIKLWPVGGDPRADFLYWVSKRELTWNDPVKDAMLRRVTQVENTLRTLLLKEKK